MVIGADVYELDSANHEWIHCQTLPVPAGGSAVISGSEIYLAGRVFTSRSPHKLFVNAAALPGGDGSSWESPFNFLQDALAATAASPDPIEEIWLTGGHYYPDDGLAAVDGDASSTFALPDKVTIRGGFEGTESDLSQRNPEDTPTILSGDIDQDDSDPDGDGVVEFASDITGTNARHVLTARADWAKIEQCVITAGSAVGNGTAAESQGGGAWVDRANLIVRNCDFRGNAAAIDGGAVFAYLSLLDVEDCEFTGNRVGDDGGAIYAWASQCKLRRCHISGNLATDQAGGIYVTDTDGYLANCLVAGNVAQNSGGGIYFKKGSTFGVFSCTLAGNFAAASGAGLFVEIGEAGTATPAPTVSNSVIWGNATADADLASASANFSDEGVSELFVPSHFLIQNLIETEGNASMDPQFVQPIAATSDPQSGGDYHLSDSSSLFDFDGFYFPTELDLDRRERRQLIGDLGAYESAAPAERPFSTSYPDLEPGGDADGDGLNNFIEHSSGSDPLVPSAPPLRIWKANGVIVLEYYQHQAYSSLLELQASYNAGGPWVSMRSLLEYQTEWDVGGAGVLPERDPTINPFAKRTLHTILAGGDLFFRLKLLRPPAGL